MEAKKNNLGFAQDSLLRAYQFILLINNNSFKKTAFEKLEKAFQEMGLFDEAKECRDNIEELIPAAYIKK